MMDKEETLVGGGLQNMKQRFVTIDDVATLLEQENAKMSKERFYPRKPPHPLRIPNKPYLDRYKQRTLAQYEGKKGSAIEHVSKFIDTLGPYATDEDLCLQEFSKFQCDQAYTWYTGLKPRSILTWDDMVEVFCSKYFH